MFDRELAYFNGQYDLAYTIQEVYNGLWMLTDGNGRVLATIRPYGMNYVLDLWREFDHQEYWERVVC